MPGTQTNLNIVNYSEIVCVPGTGCDNIYITEIEIKFRKGGNDGKKKSSKKRGSI